MKQSLRPRLTYANVIASIALFVALSGVAVAAGLPKHSVGPKQLKRGAVTAAAIKKGAVTSGKLGPKSVVAGKLGPNAVGPGNIGNGAVTSDKIVAGAVIASSIKNGVITTNKLTNNNVTTAKIAEANVTTAKLANGAVTTAKLGPEVLNNVANLKTGQTLRGVFDIGGTNPGKTAFTADGSLTFQQALAAAPTVTVLKKGATTAACPGLGGGTEQTPGAAAGNLCVYLTTETNLDATAPLTAESGTRLGLGLVAKSAEKEGTYAAIGQWAVTAP